MRGWQGTWQGRVTGVVALVVSGAFALAACGGDDSLSASKSTTTTTMPAATTTTAAATTTAPPTSAPPTTTTVAGCRDAVCAVAAWLAGEGHGYAGDCAATTTDQIPQWCSSLHTDGATQKVYYVGPVFSEVAKILTVTESGGTWTVTNTDDPPPLGAT